MNPSTKFEDPTGDSSDAAVQITDGDASAHPNRLCRKCSALSETEGEFCPYCGASFTKRSRIPKRVKITLLIVLAVLIAGSVTTAVVIKNHRDKVAAERQAAIVQAAAAEKRAAEARQREEAAAQEAARQEARRQKRIETQQEIALRHSAERDMEKSITKWADKQVVAGVLGPPAMKRTSCTPIGGGSENLSDITIRYDCLAINEDNADGTSTGYAVHATMDFSSGEYTWGLGKS